MVKNLLLMPVDIRDMDLIPGLGGSPGGGHVNPLQRSCLENPMDGGAWGAVVHRVTKRWTWLKQLSMNTHELIELRQKENIFSIPSNLTRLRRLLRVPWTGRRSNQSTLKEISPEYSLEGLMLKLKLQYFGHLMWESHLKTPWCWERLREGGEGDDRGWDSWMASPTERTWVWVNSRSWWWAGRSGVLQSVGLQRIGHEWATELNWETPGTVMTV